MLIMSHGFVNVGFFQMWAEYTYLYNILFNFNLVLLLDLGPDWFWCESFSFPLLPLRQSSLTLLSHGCLNRGWIVYDLAYWVAKALVVDLPKIYCLCAKVLLPISLYNCYKVHFWLTAQCMWWLGRGKSVEVSGNEWMAFPHVPTE